jgi:hypothetical protein
MKTKLQPTRLGLAFLDALAIILAIGLLVLVFFSGGGGIDVIPAKKRITHSTITAIESALERYYEKHGKYPSPVNPGEMIEITPGNFYPVGAAKCLYQVTRGDGVDAVKEAEMPVDAPAASNGTFESAEQANVIFKDMPRQMWRELNGHFFLVDGFGRPFQYVKADPTTKNTRNTNFDLWSYGEDDTEPQATSLETAQNPSVGAKWIKNW